MKKYLFFLGGLLLGQSGFTQTVYPTSYSLAPYTGSWTTDEASHLLRRTLFGPRLDQIDAAVADGMDNTVDNLLVANMWPVQPLAFDPVDSLATIGSTWVNTPYPGLNQDEVWKTRRRSLVGWMAGRLFTEDSTIVTKMDLFWHNHFACAFSQLDLRSSYQYFELIRNHSLGNFKTLIKEMSINTAMLEFLNGDSNVESNPNENFAREILELYSIGKGLEVSSSDYGRYTELDVTEGAKIFTGYSIVGQRSTTVATPYALFTPSNHDNTSKTLSYHFGSATIAPNGATEYEDYIDVIFSHPDFSEYICEAIYRFFVGEDVTQDVRDNVIAGMAQTLSNNNFEILPVMNELLKSEHFYDVALRGGLIKSPVDFAYSMYNPTGLEASFGLESNTRIYLNIKNKLQTMGMNLSFPPTVSSWPAYYQAPNYSREWVGSLDLRERQLYIDNEIMTGVSFGSDTMVINGVDFLNSLSTPSDADAVIDDLIKIYIVGGLDANDRATLFGTLTDNLPAFEWSILYSNYLNDPTTYAAIVDNRIKETLRSLFKLYTFQTF